MQTGQPARTRKHLTSAPSSTVVVVVVVLSRAKFPSSLSPQEHSLTLALKWPLEHTLFESAAHSDSPMAGS